MSHTTLSLKLIFSCSRQVCQAMPYPATAYPLQAIKKTYPYHLHINRLSSITAHALGCPKSICHNDQHHHCDSVSSFLKLNTIAVSQPHCDSVSSFLQTEHHSTFNMQQMISEEVAGMARPERFLAHHVELSCQLHRKSPRVSRHATIVQLLFQILIVELKEYFKIYAYGCFLVGFSGRGKKKIISMF